MRLSYVVFFMDAPISLSCAVTPIPGSGSPPLQVVARAAGDGYWMIVRDGIQTEYIEVLTGPAGFEERIAVIGGPGPSEIPARVMAYQRVSVRSLGASAIVAGSLCISFMSK